jgi:hypothetical protein
MSNILDRDRFLEFVDDPVPARLEAGWIEPQWVIDMHSLGLELDSTMKMISNLAVSEKMC